MKKVAAAKPLGKPNAPLIISEPCISFQVRDPGSGTRIAQSTILVYSETTQYSLYRRQLHLQGVTQLLKHLIHACLLELLSFRHD
jgi:hypothetical protein